MIQTTGVMLLTAALAQAPMPPPPPPRPAAPIGQPRDVVRGPEPTGTAMIRGRVVASDTGSPIRRANVNLQPVQRPQQLNPPPGAITTSVAMISSSGGMTQMPVTAMGRPRTVTTDSQGAFEFTGLPAGAYRIMVSPGQYSAGYLGIAFGAKRPIGAGSDPGILIELSDGQRFDKATVALPKGAVISGRVTDDNGDPMARVSVYTLYFAPGSTRPTRTGAGAQTDDLGQFRLYGLNSGDYFVVAEARGPTFVPPNAPAETEEDKIGFMTTYFPGTPDEGAAQRVRTRAGAETPGLEFRMATGRLFRVSGMVTDSQGRPVARSNGQLARRTGNSASSFGFSTDEQGRFAMRNIPPGAYRLIARGGRPAVPGQVEVPQNESGELGIVPLTIGSDLEGLLVTLSPGATITGQIVFEQGPPQLPPGQQSFQMRVNGMIGDPETGFGMNTPPPALVTPDLTFTMRGLHGEMLLRTGGPGMFLKSVTVSGRDITDTPYEFKTGDQVTVTMTTKVSTLEGTVTDAAGKPVADAAILVFSDERSTWRFNGTRTRRGSVDAWGKYRVPGLLPGRYYVIATARERLNVPSPAMDPTFFEQLAKEATPFVVGEDEQRQVDLKVATGSGG